MNNVDKAAALLNEECARLQLFPLDEEQIEALIEALSDVEQCFAMLDDMEHRCGMGISHAWMLMYSFHCLGAMS